MRLFFWASNTYVKTDAWELNHNFILKMFAFPALCSQGVNSVTVRRDSLWKLSMMLYEKGYRFFTLG